MIENKTYGTYFSDYYENYTDNFCDKGSYYHYTSLENCVNLLNHNNGVFEIWASHLSYLNDKEELINGLNLIDRKVEDLLLSKDNKLRDWVEKYLIAKSQSPFSNEIFVICFCRDRSLLSQWKYYGKDSGIAIEYNLDKCEYSGYINRNEENLNDSLKFIQNGTKRVIYKDLQKQKIIDEYIKKYIYKEYDKYKKYKNKEIDDDIQQQIERKICRNMDKLYSFAPLFKHSSFAEEKESRLIFYPLYSEPFTNAGNIIHYREKNGKIIPYMKIKIRGMKNEDTRHPVIKSLTVGPSENQELIFEALKHLVMTKFPQRDSQFELIKRKEYSYIVVNGIEIRKASSPFRG